MPSPPMLWSRADLYEEDFPWTVIDGRVYAIGEFVPKHPGGPLIQRAIGEDATELFHTHHTTTQAWKALARYEIGHLRGSRPFQDAEHRPFQEELNRRIGDLHKAPRFPLAEAVAGLMLALFLVWAFLAYASGWWRLDVLLAWFWWRHLDSGLHSASHGDFRYNLVCQRFFFGIYSTLSHRALPYYFGEVALRGTGLSKHFWHHVHTNDAKQDPDWTTMTGRVWVRRHESAAWQPCHAWQCWYCLPMTLLVEPCLELLHVAILCLEALAALLEPPSETPLRHRVGDAAALFLEVLFNPGFQGITFFLQPWWRALAVLLLARATARLILYPFSEVQHYMPELIHAAGGEAHSPDVDHASGSTAAETGVEEWAITQLRRTANLRFDNPVTRALDFLMFHGDSHQIEHHLWPAMSFVNFRRAAHIVRSTCAEFAVPYHEVGYWQGYVKIWGQVCVHTCRPLQHAEPSRPRGEAIASEPLTEETAQKRSPHPAGPSLREHKKRRVDGLAREPPE